MCAASFLGREVGQETSNCAYVEHVNLKIRAVASLGRAVNTKSICTGAREEDRTRLMWAVMAASIGSEACGETCSRFTQIPLRIPSGVVACEVYQPKSRTNCGDDGSGSKVTAV